MSALVVAIIGMLVIAGLDPAIHRSIEKTWMPGSSPGMTAETI